MRTDGRTDGRGLFTKKTRKKFAKVKQKRTRAAHGVAKEEITG